MTDHLSLSPIIFHTNSLADQVWGGSAKHGMRLLPTGYFKAFDQADFKLVEVYLISHQHAGVTLQIDLVELQTLDLVFVTSNHRFEVCHFDQFCFIFGALPLDSVLFALLPPLTEDFLIVDLSPLPQLFLELV